MRKALWTVLALSLAALATVAAVPPNLSTAITAQQKLAAERPDDPTVQNDLGNLLQLAKHSDEAEAAYRHAIELDGKRASFHFNLGLVLEKRGENRNAMKEYKAAVDLEPRHAWAHYQIGALLEKAGRNEAAIRSYARAFALDPQLGFPEVNPSLLDSKLTTSAMLRAYRTEDSQTLTAARYDDPQHIRGLLVPTPPIPTDETAVDPDAAAAEANAVKSSKAAPPTVLRPGNLQSTGKAGQVQPAGAAGRTGSRVYPRGGNPGLQTWSRPEPVDPPVYDDGSEEEIPVEGEDLTPPPPPSPGSVYYNPGLPSTGRLDLRLVPGRAARRTETVARVGRG
ncbi:MAG TPA: tetratricopeptide repeat protein [Thermoanaerobaculia bacterium]|nr:tetratricopeptide repeat protein [Thermoanaerobaculia bacterium]